MKKTEIVNAVKTTLKLQPIVILYSFVSIGSKLASQDLPVGSESIWEFAISCLTNLKLICIYAFMFLDLMVYAVIWQRCIKNVNITVMYANKSSYIFWTQLAAILLFAEQLSVTNILGIVVIFIGILVVNKHE